jgi:hypothetical protein
MGGAPNGDCRQPCGYRAGNRSAGLQRQNQCQRPGPEGVGQCLRSSVKHTQLFCGFPITNMHDKGIKIGTPLCRIDARYGFRILRVCRKAINRLRGNRYNLSGAKKLRRSSNRSVVSGHNPAIPQGI